MAAEVEWDENLHSKSKVPKYPINAQGLNMVYFSIKWNFWSLFPKLFFLMLVRVLWVIKAFTYPGFGLLYCFPWGAGRTLHLQPGCAGILHHYLEFSWWIFFIFLVPTWATSSKEVPPCSASQGLEIHFF